MRAAPSLSLTSAPSCVSSFRITVHVLEPEESYRIPHRPPSSVIKPRFHCLSKRKAAVLANKVAKQELMKKERKGHSQNNRFSRICEISCNSAKTFHDHVNSRSYQIRVENKKCAPDCGPWGRTFESYGLLARHRSRATHLKVVTKKV